MVGLEEQEDEVYRSWENLDSSAVGLLRTRDCTKLFVLSVIADLRPAYAAEVDNANHVSVEQKVLILILYIICQGHTFRDTCMDFQHSANRAQDTGRAEQYRQPFWEPTNARNVVDRKTQAMLDIYR